MRKIFKRSNLTAIGFLAILIALSCDLDKSNTALVIAILLVGAVLCIVGGMGYENTEDFD